VIFGVTQTQNNIPYILCEISNSFLFILFDLLFTGRNYVYRREVVLNTYNL
jgi:hypothetical protein